jgi:hypothetical protein
MRRVAILLMVLAAAASGCRKKSAPQFYELQSTYTILSDRHGDDAYAMPEMDQVLAALEQIPADTVEGPKAATLVSKIKSERERLAREAKEREAAMAAAATPPTTMPTAPSLFPREPAPKPEAVDAGGPTKPWGGMKVADLQKWFGSCFEQGPNKTLPGQPEGTTQQVKDDPKCRAAFGSTDPASTTFYVFVKDALVGQTTETRKVTETVKPSPPRPAGDAGTTGPFLVIPGAPAPEGYNGIPGAPQGAPPPAPTQQ